MCKKAVRTLLTLLVLFSSFFAAVSYAQDAEGDSGILETGGTTNVTRNVTRVAEFGSREGQVDRGFEQGVTGSRGQDAVSYQQQQSYALKSSCSSLEPASWFAGCLTFLIIPTGGKVLEISGNVFNFFFSLTLNRDFYDAPYIDLTWAVLRDLANLTFILGIIAVAFMLILGGMGGIDYGGRMFDWKKSLTRLIVIALLINFTMFGARVLVDVGNLTAQVFVNQIRFPGPETDFSSEYGNPLGAQIGVAESQARYYPISDAFIQNLRIESLLGPSNIQNLGGGANGNNHGFWFFFNVIYIAVTFGMAFTLFFTSFYFLARTISIIVLMIVSPLAAVAFFLPGTVNLGKKWLSSLVANCFCVSAYVFFLYLLVILTKAMATTITVSIDPIDSGTEAIKQLLNVGMPVVILVLLTIFLLLTANKQVQKMCQAGLDAGGKLNIGRGFQKATLGLARGVGAVGTGVGGLAARGVVGGLGYKMSKGEWGVRNLARSGGLTGALGQGLMDVGENWRKKQFGLKNSYDQQVSEKSKLLEVRANRLANLEAEAQRPEFEAAAKKALQEQFLSEGMSEAEARENAEGLAKIKADAEVKQVKRAFGKSILEKRSAPVDILLSGFVSGAKDQALKTYNLVDQQDAGKRLKEVENRSDQRKKTARNSIIEARSNAMTEKVVSEIKLGKIPMNKIEDKLLEATKQSYMDVVATKDADGKVVEKEMYLPGGELAKAHRDAARVHATAIKEANKGEQFEEKRQRAEELSQNASILKRIVDKVNQRKDTNPLLPVAVDEREMGKLKSLGIQTSRDGTITVGDSLRSLESAYNSVAAEQTDAQKEFEKSKKKMDKALQGAEKAIKKAAAQQTRSRSETEAALAGVRQEATMEEARLSVDQSKDGFAEDVSREEIDTQ